jgi:hypothetical protein
MSERKLRVGIIGMGQWVAGEHIPNLRATGRAEVVSAARRNPERLALAQRELNIPEVYTDWREMLTRTNLCCSASNHPKSIGSFCLTSQNRSRPINQTSAGSDTRVLTRGHQNEYNRH